jgi:hypothetical protein
MAPTVGAPLPGFAGRNVQGRTFQKSCKFFEIQQAAEIDRTTSGETEDLLRLIPF